MIPTSPIPHPPLIWIRERSDIVDGNGTADANGSVDSTPGIYHITYSATDTAGNVAVQMLERFMYTAVWVW